MTYKRVIVEYDNRCYFKYNKVRMNYDSNIELVLK